MTKEQIWEEAEKEYGNASGTIDNMPAQWLVDEARRGYVTAATKYLSMLEEKEREIERMNKFIKDVKDRLEIIDPKDIANTDQIVVALIMDINKSLNTYKPGSK